MADAKPVATPENPDDVKDPKALSREVAAKAGVKQPPKELAAAVGTASDFIPPELMGAGFAQQKKFAEQWW